MPVPGIRSDVGYPPSMATRPEGGPAGLVLVQELVNTRDVEAGTDRLTDPAHWSAWVVAQGLDPAYARISAGELARVTRLREGLRDALIANHDGAPTPPAVTGLLTETATWAGLSTEFGADGPVVVSRSPGARGAVGAVLAGVATAMTDGSWSRLKACGNPSCRWAFYDSSRSRTGTWCSMQVCGNRAKQRRWRERTGSRSA